MANRQQTTGKRRETTAETDDQGLLIAVGNLQYSKRSTAHATLMNDCYISKQGPSDGFRTSKSGSGEPVSKRRVLRHQHDGSTATNSSQPFDGLRETFQHEVDPSNLPEPSMKISPDEYLLLLLKTQSGVSFQAKPGLSLESFFNEITEEQIAAYTTNVVRAVRNNDLESLKKLKDEGQPLNCSNRFGESLLNMACRRGFESIVEFLLSHEEVDIRICDDSGRTPLHDACWNPSPQLNICRWIIERDPSLLLVADRRGCTAFQYARSEHWSAWRQFLFDNRKCLSKLAEPDLVSRLS